MLQHIEYKRIYACILVPFYIQAIEYLGKIYITPIEHHKHLHMHYGATRLKLKSAKAKDLNTQNV